MTRRPGSIPLRIVALSGPPRALPRGPYAALGDLDPKPASNALIWGLGGAVAVYLALLGLMAFNENRRRARPRVVRNQPIRF